MFPFKNELGNWRSIRTTAIRPVMSHDDGGNLRAGIEIGKASRLKDYWPLAGRLYIRMRPGMARWRIAFGATTGNPTPSA
jgi:hypothetical protein